MSEVRICPPGELVAGEARAVDITADKHGRPRQALIVLDGAGTPRAYLNRCRHLPIPIDSGSGQYLNETGDALLCITHGATYRLDDGMCTWGPCKGQALYPLVLIERDGCLWLTDDDGA